MIEVAQRPLTPLLRAYRFVNRPYYWQRPSQLAIRARIGEDPAGAAEVLRTAWGSQLYCWPDPLGRAVARTGVYDLVVTETLARLSEPGETVADAGANVGFMTNLLAHAVGKQGRVVCFEPHPLILQTLRRNVTRMREQEAVAVVDVRAAAVSDQAGSTALAIDPATFAANKGTASLEDVEEAHSVTVEAVRLDDAIPDGVGVLKLDVEGHELAALRGAHSLLSRGLIRDIVFEEHQRAPTPVTDALEAHGYTVLGVRQGIRGPIVSAPAEAYDRALWDPPALVASRDPGRVRLLLSPRGWSCLHGRFRSGSSGR